MTQPNEITLSDGSKLPCYHYHTVIVGSGAAGLNAAEHLRELLPGDCQLAIITSALTGGTSYCSGSDKQTYWRLGAVGTFADDPQAMAETLAAGGCMHGDIALAEAEGSVREFFHLVRNGVPFPQTSLGTFVGYRTDHDPLPRATSAGPWTSRYMVACSLERVRSLGIPIFDSHEAVGIVTAEGESQPRCVGLIVVDHNRCNDEDFGLVIFVAQNVIMATGGPGELYARTVYPEGQMGTHGVCFEAGLVAANLTESQFGLASLNPRWNLSGSYQQVLPSYYSTDQDGGDKRDFLAEIFSDPDEYVLAIFRKGYQWPFTAQRAAPPGSSAIDVLVHWEISRGRRVWMDYRTNPISPLNIEDLPEEAREYLQRSGAIGDTPYKRLEQMNPAAVELYASKGVDLSSEPLEIGLSAQHNNGGFAVDHWWESSLPHLFIIGELAGTHGVTRPGGAALNSGQVGGLRAAQRIAHVYSDSQVERLEPLVAAAEEMRKRLSAYLSTSESDVRPEELRHRIRDLMTQVAGPLRPVERIDEATDEVAEIWQALREGKVTVQAPQQAVEALADERLALTAWGYLEALRAYINQGGGSRGSYLITDSQGTPLHPDLARIRIRSDNEEHRRHIIQVSFDGTGWISTVVPVRPIPDQEVWFEQVWQRFQAGEIWQR